MDLSDRERARLADAIRAAEARTTGEIVCVLAQTSSAHATSLPVLVAAAAALALPWLLMLYTSLPLQLILSLQLLVFVVLLAACCLPAVRVALVPRAIRRALAHRLAMEQFMVRGVSRTRQRTGILIFVSLAERYARIIADEGIAQRVSQAEWQGAIDSLVAHMREGRLADGFIAAIGLCSDVLARNFPSAGAEPDELPDRIYLI